MKYRIRRVIRFYNFILVNKFRKSKTCHRNRAFTFAVPCPTPFNISYDVMGTTTIRVYWSGLPCRIPGARIYLYFQQLSFLEDSNYEWHVTGASGNATFHENALTVQDLGIALPYEGYMMYSIEGVGNGAPSERFRFRTHYSRKNVS